MLDTIYDTPRLFIWFANNLETDTEHDAHYTDAERKYLKLIIFFIIWDISELFGRNKKP